MEFSPNLRKALLDASTQAKRVDTPSMWFWYYLGLALCHCLWEIAHPSQESL